MYSHEQCTHPKTKVARAACRRDHQTGDAQGKQPVGKKNTTGAARDKVRGARLPSLIAPKLRPVIDKAKAKGLKIRIATDPADGVEQAFVILNPKRPDCELIAEAFRAASTGREGRAEFWHVEEGKSRQLSSRRALDDLDQLARS